MPLCWQPGTVRGVSKLVLDGRAVIDVELENIFSPSYVFYPKVLKTTIQADSENSELMDFREELYLEYS